MTNLIPGKGPGRRGHGVQIMQHARFVIWAMQQENIDDITVRRVARVFNVATATAQKLRSSWRDLMSTTFYRDAVPGIVRQHRR